MMRAEIDIYGNLTIQAENPCEQYTLRHWRADWEAGKVTLGIKVADKETGLEVEKLVRPTGEEG